MGTERFPVLRPVGDLTTEALERHWPTMDADEFMEVWERGATWGPPEAPSPENRLGGASPARAMPERPVSDG
jgi:hypothetical protein